jgi:ATP-binding cassette subfamily C protein
VGPSGCGKSTLLKLLLGFEAPNSGTVMVDRKDLRSLNKSAYRRQLGVVLQNGNLISGSIYENITITAPEANYARVNEVVAQVGLKDDIAQMPMGLHTMLGETSNTISGGQKQRILIARAICGSPKILIFDEATSALDNLTQAAVSSNLDKMDVTRIVVAHRLSTIKNCDRIIVFNNGEIVQEGTYNTLMNDRNGLFHALASRQIAE